MPATRRKTARAQSKEPTPPVRRSTRIAASQASSRASSMAPSEADDNDNDVAQPTAELSYIEEEVQEPSPKKKSPPPPQADFFSPKKVVKRPVPVNRVSKRISPYAPNHVPWTAADAIRRIVVDNDREYIKTLTEMQKDAVISAFTDREKALTTRFEEILEERDQLQYKNERLKKERDAEKALRLARPSIRDIFMYERRHGKPHPRSLEALEAKGPQTEPNKKRKSVDEDNVPSKKRKSLEDDSTPTRASATFKAPAPSSDDTTQTQAQSSSSPIDKQAAPSTPPTETTPVSEPLQQHARAQTEVQKPKSWFSRIYSVVTNPFASPTAATVAAQQQQPEAQQTNHLPLGDLNGSRKRTFTEVEPEPEAPSRKLDLKSAPTIMSTPKLNTTLRTSSTTSKAVRTRKPETPRAAAPTPLTTISEHSENTELNAANEAKEEDTPLRPYRSVTKMRREQREREERQRTSRTPARTWIRPSAPAPPAPREPNADERLKKIEKFRKLEKEFEAMKQDQDIQELVARPTKRVKVDDLVSIPPRKPTESQGTFGLPDEDSDDEMEVDIDAPLRSNLFVPPEQEAATPPPWNAPMSKVTPTATPTPAQATVEVNGFHFPTVGRISEAQAEEPEVSDPFIEQAILGFPSVGKIPDHLIDQTEDRVAGAKFAYGLEHWIATGETLPW